MPQTNNSDPPGRRVSLAEQASSVIGRNTLWNLLGFGLPVLLLVVTIPVLIYSAGTERFGVYTIALALLSYFSLLDLGLGRAAVKFLAEAFENNRIVEIRGMFWTFSILTGLMGLLGTLLLAALTPLLINGVLNVPENLQTEARRAFYVLALGIPLVTITTTFQATLESQHRFGVVSVLQFFNSTLNQAAPLFVLLFSYSLEWLVGALVLSRLWGAITFLVVALRHLDRPFRGPFFLRNGLRAFVSYSLWQSVTNIVSPIMENADRFIIGALSVLSAVAYYATPSEIIKRLLILSLSLGRTTFPIFSAAGIKQRTYVYVKYSKYLMLILAPLSGSILVFASDVLYLWLGTSFAQESSHVLQILAVGLLVNSLAILPFFLIQGSGRPDITAKFHLLELPFYLLLLWVGIQHWGINGAALAWTTRAGADFVLLTLYTWFTNSVNVQVVREERLRQIFLLSLLLLAIGWLLQVLTTLLLLKVGIWSALLGAVAYLAWQHTLTLEEQERVANYGRRVAISVKRLVRRAK